MAINTQKLNFSTLDRSVLLQGKDCHGRQGGTERSIKKGIDRKKRISGTEYLQVNNTLFSERLNWLDSWNIHHITTQKSNVNNYSF